GIELNLLKIKNTICSGRNCFLSMKQASWKQSPQDAVSYVMENHVLPRIKNISLEGLNKFEIQNLLNELSEGYSESVVDKTKTYIHAVLEEAVDQEFISKNPARKV